MPVPNFFLPSGFDLLSLTAAINHMPYKPMQIQAAGLFSESGITTTVVAIEEEHGVLRLLDTVPRGGPGHAISADKRKVRPFQVPHIPQVATIMADEIQNIRAFGSETVAQTINSVRDARLRKMRDNIDVTHEWHRAGAIKGQIVEPVSGDLLLDLFVDFGVTQQSVDFDLGTGTTSIRVRCDDTITAIEDALGAAPYTSIRAFCGQTFWKALISHPKVEETYLNTQQAAALRGDPHGSFDFGGITWERYRNSSSAGSEYIPNGEAYAVPVGVTDMFIARFAPADYNETVNTMGRPYYAKAEVMRMAKGIELEGQSNPLFLNTRPAASIRLYTST